MCYYSCVPIVELGSPSQRGRQPTADSAASRRNTQTSRSATDVAQFCTNPCISEETDYPTIASFAFAMVVFVTDLGHGIAHGMKCIILNRQCLGEPLDHCEYHNLKKSAP